MDANRMKRELGGGAVFPIGAENTAYAQYFTGECYLNMLTTSGVGKMCIRDRSSTASRT